MAKWMIANKKADFDGLAREFSIKNITARLIANRLITDRTKESIQCSEEAVKTYISGDISFLHNPFLMKDMEKGAKIILDKIGDNKSIRVIGDYDVDGICSSYILVSGLKLFGADVDCVLPDRIKDGYGLSVKLVDEAYEAGIDTIITCDNGIAAAEQIEHAKKKGMTVVVTDHHEVPFEMGDDENKKEILPPADAVIDPKRSEGEYPFKEICGAVVAYKFLEAMSELNKEAGPSEAEREEFFFQKLIFAGIATVCDVMELKDENRVIVRESLKRIPKTDNKGLKALIDVNGLDAYHMTGYNYGFVIGPCLNATGRLDLATRALSLFLEEDAAEAAKIAGDLKSLNDSRKDMTKNGVDEAVTFVEQEIEKGGMPKVIVLYLPEVHESIAGIIAGKIKEKYYRPTIVLTKAADGGAKGSGRSIESYDMYEELSRCKELFTKFGGHKMAAGLSLPEENIEILRTKLNENCNLTEEDFVPVLHLDMVMPLKYIDMDLVKEFSILEPFGTGNSKPLFAQRDVSLLSGRIMGKNKNCGKYRVTDEGGKLYDMLFFGDMERWHNFLREKYGENNVENLYSGATDGSMKVSIAYQPDINTYQGRESIQIIMNDFT
ncbi:single-stranded-DNA-specific exonuclease RecJ [Butyrivibrio sp. M55]|uniref:single-stranded-DNA-specific exonuclease RecJ n=1 Tax=Butyrivibrio sp. M55 TaxID=1855323 RepID=UPI0008E8D50C|nr:single-stranded-DNA-specific exonuclease RecJ [Butyrivibrio sp. M55]SFU45302.1 exonuclease RecJ [Butyrivibrio sp. M55]